MALTNPDATSAELDKLQAIEPDEDMIAHMKAIDDKAHIESHLDALEEEYPTLDTTAVRASLG